MPGADVSRQALAGSNSELSHNKAVTKMSVLCNCEDYSEFLICKVSDKRRAIANCLCGSKETQLW
jgi:hypothetical protein